MAFEFLPFDFWTQLNVFDTQHLETQFDSNENSSDLFVNISKALFLPPCWTSQINHFIKLTDNFFKVKDILRISLIQLYKIIYDIIFRTFFLVYDLTKSLS